METKAKQLKKRIENKSIDNSFLVLCSYENSFIANQYVNEIIKIKNRQKVVIDSLDNISPGQVFETDDNNTYVLHVDDFNSSISNFYPYKNFIVVCTKIADKTRDNVVATGVLCLLPKLQEWQVLDYIKFNCNGLTNQQVKLLYDMSNGDIYRINNEILKLSLFESDFHSEMFKKIDDDGGYSDLSYMTIFNLTTALIKKDIGSLTRIMSEICSMGIDSMALLSVLYKNLKNIIDVKLTPKSTPESLDMSEKQYKAITYSYSNVSSTKIINLFDFITSIDYKLKSGLLQLSDDRFIDYMVCNMLSRE